MSPFQGVEHKTIFNGDYVVTVNGDVYSMKRKTGPHKMSLIRKASGTYQVTLKVKGKSKSFRIHRLVYDIFIGLPKDERHWIRHIDGDVRNNKLDNLISIPKSDNYALGGMYKRIMERNNQI